jgi:hypothetical protein
MPRTIASNRRVECPELVRPREITESWGDKPVDNDVIR